MHLLRILLEIWFYYIIFQQKRQINAWSKEYFYFSILINAKMLKLYTLNAFFSEIFLVICVYLLKYYFCLTNSIFIWEFVNKNTNKKTKNISKSFWFVFKIFIVFLFKLELLNFNKTPNNNETTIIIIIKERYTLNKFRKNCKTQKITTEEIVKVHQQINEKNLNHHH